MRVWLLQSRPGEPSAGLGSLLRQWVGQPENGHWQADMRLLVPALVADVQFHQPEVLLVAEMDMPAGPWVDQVLTLGSALVAAAAPGRVEPYRALGERFPVHLVPAPPTLETLGFAILAAHASQRRELSWKSRLDQVQQRLNDRIVIERAKGILVQRLGISEEEAYKRLRTLSRRQRRQIRDIAQSLLDTEALFAPEANGFVDHPAENGVWGPEPPG